jgi:hypothetical protein
MIRMIPTSTQIQMGTFMRACYPYQSGFKLHGVQTHPATVGRLAFRR